MKQLGTITIDVSKDDRNQYSFEFNHSNDNLSCIVNVLQDTLKYY